jgi:hypothetical protein
LLGRRHAASTITFRSSRLLAAAPISEDPEIDYVGKLSSAPSAIEENLV